VANGLFPTASKPCCPQEFRLLAYRLGRAGELALEAHRLVIARRRTHVAQRQPVFDERGSPVSLTGMQCDRVLADRAAERFRVHSVAPNQRPVIHWRGLSNPPCLVPVA
jgi:hypothetical protein